MATPFRHLQWRKLLLLWPRGYQYHQNISKCILSSKVWTQSFDTGKSESFNLQRSFDPSLINWSAIFIACDLCWLHNQKQKWNLKMKPWKRAFLLKVTISTILRPTWVFQAALHNTPHIASHIASSPGCNSRKLFTSTMPPSQRAKHGPSSAIWSNPWSHCGDLSAGSLEISTLSFSDTPSFWHKTQICADLIDWHLANNASIGCHPAPWRLLLTRTASYDLWKYPLPLTSPAPPPKTHGPMR